MRLFPRIVFAFAALALSLVATASTGAESGGPKATTAASTSLPALSEAPGTLPERTFERAGLPRLNYDEQLVLRQLLETQPETVINSLAKPEVPGGWMDQPLADFGWLVVTPWKLVGYLGVALFAGRWVVQILVSGKERRVMMPVIFWWMSFIGGVLLLTYFTLGKNDSVGVLANLTAPLVGAYNLYLFYGHRKRLMAAPGVAKKDASRTASEC